MEKGAPDYNVPLKLEQDGKS